MDTIFVPPDFYCPISGELMKDPVSDHEGHSYEKHYILEWLSKNNTSPMTRSILRIEQLTMNLALKKSIESIREKLTEDQMKIKSRIYDKENKEFNDSLHEIQLNPYYLDDNLFVNIQMPDTKNRPSVDIVLCIDVSASMGAEATLKGDKNETISHGFSVLSLTISAAKTILHSLNEKDNLSVVIYSEKAQILFSNLPCSNENKKIIETKLDSLRPTYNTNMWSGIMESLEILRLHSLPNRLKGILLLTDGIPNVEPPRGHESMLKKYFKDNNFKCMISCYGFGYQLNSELLLNLSNISGGDGFSFIPDASLLGNIFIHGLSNLFTTAAYNPYLKIHLKNNLTFKDTSETGTENKKIITIDSLKYGQDKNLIFQLDAINTDRIQDHIDSSVELTLHIGDQIIKSNQCKRPIGDYYFEQIYRRDAISVLDDCILKKRYNYQNIDRILNKFIDKIRPESKKNEYIRNILFDFEGQIREALNMTTQGMKEDWFNRWGLHYLRSLLQAYKNEICNNFKDKGVSNFGGKLFENLRDEITTLFREMPPPKADIKYPGRATFSHNVKASPPVSMRQYVNASGGCCAGHCHVFMEDNSYKKARDIKKGDRVVTYSTEQDSHGRYHEMYSVSTIECVVKTYCSSGKEMMVKLGELCITPYHPIIYLDNYEKNWRYPVSIKEPELVQCEAMYTFIVENRQHLKIERFVYATLGHNIRGNVIHHDYFGTNKVIDDLKKINTYDQGYVHLTQDMFHRGENNDVISISN